MRQMLFGILIGVTTVVLIIGASLAQERGNPSNADPTAACLDMMQGQGVTEEGKKAMREFMQSDRASPAMANIMEMMGGQGGMMGGQGGMMQPGGAQTGQ